METVLPYNFQPRDYQLPFLKAIDNGCKRLLKVWHRRSGKEKTDVNATVKETQKFKGIYYYIFPELNQGRKVLWDGVDKDGFPFIQHFPYEIRAGEPNNTEMKIKLKNGSLWQIVGGDRFNSVMGTNPRGIVFSEYSLQSPQAWGYFRPILAENGGWAVFNFTPRGENHAFDLFNLAKANPKEWFCDLRRASDTKAIPQEVLDRERAEIIKLYGNDALYRQEYECDFSVPIVGAYYSAQIMRAYEHNRITVVPYEPRLPVFTYWDLGVDDTTVIWFAQKSGGQVRLIDYYENREQGLPHYVKVLKEKPYIYARHVAPHDIKVREWGGGISRIETAKSLGIEFDIAPSPQEISVEDGIDAARALLERSWFDSEKCADGINALKNYRKIWDDDKKCYLDRPYHDWSSNGADAFRTMAISIDLQIGEPTKNKEWHHPAVQAVFNRNRLKNPYQGRALPEAEWRKLHSGGR